MNYHEAIAALRPVIDMTRLSDLQEQAWAYLEFQDTATCICSVVWNEKCPHHGDLSTRPEGETAGCLPQTAEDVIAMVQRPYSDDVKAAMTTNGCTCRYDRDRVTRNAACPTHGDPLT